MPKLAIILLGAPNDENGNLSSIAVERCEQVLRELTKNPGAKILPTGGWGEHFNTTNKPHGYYIGEYLKKRNVAATDILEVAESTNTIEDARLSQPIVERHGIDELLIVTSDFHVPRARFLFERQFPGMKMRFCGSPTDLPALELARRVAHEEQALTRLQKGDMAA
ncbi:hypothetical protein BH09VER1_BH09VER1_41080 [soil metagenome]